MIKNSQRGDWMTKDEIALVKQVQAGKQGAFDDLFQVYYGKAYAIAYRIMNNDADAKDAAQESMLEVYRSISTLKEPGYFYAWMIRIVISKCNRIYRKNKTVLIDPLTMQATQTYEEKRPYMIPKRDVEYRFEQDILLGLIYSLKPQMAEVLDLMYIKQMKLQEIAQYMNIPINTVKTRAVRGRKLLKEQIEQYEKLEGRKLNFHINLPISVFGFAMISQFIKSQSKQVITSITQYASGGATQMVCVVSFSVLTVTGAVFVVEDVQNYQAAKQQSALNQKPMQKEESPIQNQPIKQENKQEEISYDNAFQPAVYGEESITTSLDAYYLCINWAYDEVEMNEKTKEEIEEILPIYQALKQKQDAYWEKLVNKGWTTKYEALLETYSIRY